MSVPNCNPQAASATLSSSTIVVSSLAQEDSGFRNASITTETSDKALSFAHTITAAPSKTSMTNLISNSSLTQGDECLLRNEYCSLQGPGHSLDGLKDECILWDTACSGNRSLATSQFFGSVNNILMSNPCFFDSSPDCSKNNPPGRMSVFNDVKNWMRSPQCMLEDPGIIEILAQSGSGYANVMKEDLFMNQTCCDNSAYCQVAADQVDVYYWSDPHANTSCLSIVGDGESDLAVGATTDQSGDVYWGCTSWSSTQGKPGPGSPLIVTTAALTSVASMTFRTYLFNPWGESPCGNSSASQDIKPRDIPPIIHPRGHSLVAPNGSVSTAVLGEYTL